MKNTTEMEDHIKIFHPNGEIKYDDDFQMTIDKFVHRPCVYCGMHFLYEYALLKDHKPDKYVCDKCTHK